MIRPVIPVARRKGVWIGPPPTTGIPHRSGWGLSVISQRTIRFIAGSVLAFGGLVVNPAQASILKGLHVESVRNDEVKGKVVKIGAVRTPPASLVGLSPKGLKISFVRNDRRDGKCIHWLVAHPPRVSDEILIHRRTSDFFKRRKPIFWRIPPTTTALTPWKAISSKIYSRALGQERYNNYRGSVIRTGPRLTGESALIVPTINRKLTIVNPQRPRIHGHVIRWSPTRATFALAVDRIPTFKVVQDRSRINARRPKGAVNRYLPYDFTQICFRPSVVIRGDEIIIPGQWNIWQPRRVDFIPSIQQNVPKILKIYRRQILPIKGNVYTFNIKRASSAFNVNKGIYIYRQRVTEFRRLTGKFTLIGPFRQNPPASGSLKHGLIRLSEFRIILSVKRENDGGTASVFAADATGTVISFNKAFKIVESITVTSLNTALQTPIYDFNHATENPTTFKVKLFDAAGARVNGTVSWKARGIL